MTNKVRIEHARHLGYCAKGMRLWCEEQGLDYMVFVNEGFDVSVFDNFKDDIMINALIEEAQHERWRQ